MNARSLLRQTRWLMALLLTVLICSPTPQAVAADASATLIKLAVFDFKLEDGSAGASVEGDRARDDQYMKAVSAEVRRVIEQSGRYQLVDVSGAEQSLTGVVRRITRTEYVVSFRLADVKTGATLVQKETDLRMGANYSWSRGAAKLIKAELLNTPD